MRKIAMGAWNHPTDPSTYAWFDIEADPLIRYLGQLNQNQVDCMVTMVHVIGKVVASCLTKYPELNQVIIRQQLYQRDTVDLFYPVVLRSKNNIDLSGISIRDAGSKSMPSIASESTQLKRDLQANQDKPIQKTKRILSLIPTPIARLLIKLIHFIMYSCNTRIWGFPSDPFGSVIISSLESFNISYGLIPLFPFSCCPLSIGIGNVEEKAVVKNHAVIAQKMIPISVTFDHRHIDGFQGGRAIKYIQKVCQNPDAYPDIFSEPSSIQTVRKAVT